jgi:ribose transport system permease protein
MPLKIWREMATQSSYCVPIAGAVITLLVVTAVVDVGSFAPGNLAAILNGATPGIIIAMAQALAVLSGRAGVDLSVGPLAGLVNAVVVVEVVGRGIDAPVVVIGVALCVGLLSGSLNGFLIAYLRVPAVVATLGTYLIYIGLTLLILPSSGGTAPLWLAHLAGDIGPIPGMLIPIVAVLVAWRVLTLTAFRRNLYAVGADERAAYTCGIDVAFIRFLAFCGTGLVASVAGLALTGILQSGDPNVASVYTLQSIAAVALGGIALNGGRGGLLGAAFGGILLFLIEHLLSVAHVDTNALQFSYGAILLLAIALNRASVVRRRRRKEAAKLPTAGAAKIGAEALQVGLPANQGARPTLQPNRGISRALWKTIGPGS